jgi:hypothetical protein
MQEPIDKPPFHLIKRLKIITVFLRQQPLLLLLPTFRNTQLKMNKSISDTYTALALLCPVLARRNTMMGWCHA